VIRRILILGASYGSLFGTKLLMAVHDVTLVCRRGTADLINMNGTEVCLPLKDEKVPRRIRSSELSGRLDAKTPEMIDPSDYDLVVLAMQELLGDRLIATRAGPVRQLVPISANTARWVRCP
jgi:ketopantoate reductase